MSLPIYVIGHKNPDTDSICAALALAELKRQTGINATAARLGTLNPETKFILDKLNVSMPVLLTTARSTLEEIEIDEAVTIEEGQTIRRAWDLCLENHVKTLYVVDDKNEYKGMVTLGDVSKVQMQDLNITSELLKETPLENLVASVKGSFILKGNLERSGFVRIADKRLMERDLKGAIMVLNDHEDSMIKSMAKGCAVIVVAENFVPNSYIIEMAKQMGVTLISTPYNIMKIIQMIYRSIPVELIMTPANKVIRFNKSEYVEDVEREMLKTRHSSYPVVFQNKILGSVARYNLLKAEKKRFILVDHNEKSQAVNGIEEAEVQEIIDHHRLGGLETIGPVYFRNQPVGCTATIIYQMYQESGVEVEPQMAGLLCSAIISDTLLFRSPTCTMVDQAAAEALARIAGIDMEEHAKEMFNAGSNLRGKSVEEICFQDFKVFNVKDIMFGVGQITSMNQDELDEVKGRLIPYLEEARKTQGLHMLYLMMTNILEESTELLCCGENAKEQVLEAFELPGDTEKILLKGVVSRKKQMIPVLVTYLQQK